MTLKPKSTYYVEMLVPRRKGQLLKLLILVPLSLLLATSIYYQFYYESSASMPTPASSIMMSAPLISYQSSDSLIEFPYDSDDDEAADTGSAAAGTANESHSENHLDQGGMIANINNSRRHHDMVGNRLLPFHANNQHHQQQQKQKHNYVARTIDENSLSESNQDFNSYLNKKQKTYSSQLKSDDNNVAPLADDDSSNNDNNNYRLLRDKLDAKQKSYGRNNPHHSHHHHQQLTDHKDDNNNNNQFVIYDTRDNQQLELDRRLKQSSQQATADPSGLTETAEQFDKGVYELDNRLNTDDQQLVLDNHRKHPVNHLPTFSSSSNNSRPSQHQHKEAESGGVGGDDTRADSISSKVESQAPSSELVREEEEADAQDNAVIPPPSDPTGPGELGRPVILKNLTQEQEKLVNVGWENNAFNQYISDLISVNRTLPDVRDPACKPLKYPNPRLLPQTSVIICFHNEAWSVLMRTVHSIINRSPRRLIKEIILVDDFSNKDHLGQQLEDYVKQLRIVKVVRAQRREGLIRARLLGAKAATAPVLTFLDSHCECAEGWIEPLLTRIYHDRKAVVCPVIDVISDKTFEYHYKGDASAISVGGFDWNLQFNWHSVPEREKKRRPNVYDPLRSPTMAGGLFSIDKAFFEELGTYDSGFDIWGGENLELSFKTWMCGGTLEILPCSHVGHVFRSRSPYKWRTGVNVLRRNSVRLAEVWMDDYKKYYYDRIGHELGDYGDISERVKLREKLQCKPFSYFVKEIYPELFIPGEAVAYGEIKNEAEGKIKMCMDSSARKTDYHKPLGVYPCHGSGGNQYWLLSRDGEIRRDEACVDYAGHDVVLFPCHGSGGNQLWLYEQDTMQVRHSTSGRCMELAKDRIRIQMSECDPGNDAQKWTFQHYNATLAAINNH